MLYREKILQRAQTGVKENRTLDFKSGFDPNSNRDWCEFIKDIVAFANSGGGAIVLGLNDDLSASGYDPAIMTAVDSADITNKIAKYVSLDFADFEVVEVDRPEGRFAAILIFAAKTPMVFRKPGTYAIEGGKQKTAFSQGTIYFRHGSKSEPATMDDLRSWLDRELEAIRQAWLGNIRQVVEAPIDQAVQVVATEQVSGDAIPARIVNDPGAMPVRPQDAEKIWPNRQVDVLNAVNRRLPVGVSVNGYDILCVRHVHQVTQDQHPEFIFRPHRNASPQYSNQFIDWIVDQYNHDNAFFVNAREAYRNRDH